MRDDRLVLCYHAVSHDWPAATAVHPDEFRRQVDLLATRRYRGVTFAEAVRGDRGGRVVAVTFDDAHASVWEHARPALAAYGWPATVFVPTAYAGQERHMTWRGNELWAPTPWQRELRCMTWDQVECLAEEGWEIGSHTVTHPMLTKVGAEERDRELRDSRNELERRLGRPCPSIAYPYGEVDEEVMAATRRAGYSFGAATQYAGSPTRLCWPRLVVSRTDRGRAFALKSLPSTRRLLSEPAVSRLKARIQLEQAPV